MFTGIVEAQGVVVMLQRRGGGARLVVEAADITPDLKVGDSVSVNGACVTVVERDERRFACDLVPETVARTNLGILQQDEKVNLERPVRATDRLGGHIVQGHVDAVGMVRSRRKVGAQEMVEITVPFELTRYLAPQGSVSLDGVSLTVVAVDRDRFRVALIPHTVAMTTLGDKVQGAPVNVEVDILSKYVERHMSARSARPTLGSLFEDIPPAREPEPAPRVVAPPRPTPKPAEKRPAPKRPAAKTPVKALKKKPHAAAKRPSPRRAVPKRAKRRR
ncbi:MAG: riboflavin synthase [Actinomycetota bacterium]|nr:riboflavin synthase [Actinomycetota bacterium]